MGELLLWYSFELIHDGERIRSAVELVRSTQKQRDSRRLVATNKNPRNLFGLESNELAKKDALAQPP